MARLPRCRYPGCKAVGKPLWLPFGEWTSVCDVHRGAASLAQMARIVPPYRPPVNAVGKVVPVHPVPEDQIRG